MADKPPMRDQIMDIAEQMARLGGYMGFSFREVAKHVNIKSASVHYHFPTKKDLAKALVQRYTERFLARLQSHVERDSAKARRQAFVAVMTHSLMEEGMMCLGGMMAAEVASLPAEVTEETQAFFAAVRDWLAEPLISKTTDKVAAQAKAMRVIALMEGAIMLSRTMDDADLFDEIAEGIDKL